MNARITTHDQPRRTLLYGGAEKVVVENDAVFVIFMTTSECAAFIDKGVTIELDDEPGDWW